MITYEYQCWKCPKWHTATANTPAEILEFQQLSGALTRIIED